MPRDKCGKMPKVGHFKSGTRGGSLSETPETPGSEFESSKHNVSEMKRGLPVWREAALFWLNRHRRTEENKISCLKGHNNSEY